MKNKKKGFTLVELIVVLAILAILAAMLVPALTGYIDKANQKKVIAETRQLVMAAQSIASDDYANNKIPASGYPDANKINDMIKFAELEGKGTATITITTKGVVTEVVWTHNGMKACTYSGTNSSYTVAS